MRSSPQRTLGPSVFARSPPSDLEADSEQHETECIGHELAHRGRHPEGAEQADCDPSNCEPADEESDPPMPEPGGSGAHGDNTEPLAAGSQQKSGKNQGQSSDQEGNQVAEHNLPQQRRPVEQQECADTADGKGRDEPEAEGEPDGDGAQPLADRVQGYVDDPGLHAARNPPEQPFDAEA